MKIQTPKRGPLIEKSLQHDLLQAKVKLESLGIEILFFFLPKKIQLQEFEKSNTDIFGSSLHTFTAKQIYRIDHSGH